MDIPSIFAAIDSANPEEAAKALRDLVPVYEARKRADPLAFFKPSSDGQRQFVMSQAYGRVTLTGNSAGKSFVAGEECASWLLNRHPYRKVPTNAHGWVGCPNEQTQKDVQQKAVLRFIPDNRIAKRIYTGADVLDCIYLVCNRCNTRPREKHTKTHSQWLCPGCGDEVPYLGFRTYKQDIQAWQAKRLHFGWLDEEPPETHFKELLARFFGIEDAGWWLTYTPVLALGWIKRKLIDTPDDDRKQVIRWNTQDNSALSLADLKQMERDFPDENERRLRFKGEYVMQEGLIFKMWSVAHNEVDALPASMLIPPKAPHKSARLKQDLEIWCGVDTGANFAAVFVAVDYDGNCWVFDEVFSFEEETHERAGKIRGVMARWGIGRVNYFALDPTSQFEIELAREGIYCTKYDHGWKAAKDATISYILGAQDPALRLPALRVLRPTCPVLLKERAVYRREPPKQSGPMAGEYVDAPLKKDDHCLDALMLVLEQRPGASTHAPKPVEEMTDIERDLRNTQAELAARNEERESEMSIDPLSGEY